MRRVRLGTHLIHIRSLRPCDLVQCFCSEHQCAIECGQVETVALSSSGGILKKSSLIVHAPVVRKLNPHATLEQRRTVYRAVLHRMARHRCVYMSVYLCVWCASESLCGLCLCAVSVLFVSVYFTVSNGHAFYVALLRVSLLFSPLFM